MTKQINPQAPVQLTLESFPAWKKVMLPYKQSAGNALVQLAERGIRVDQNSMAAIKNISFGIAQREIELFNLSARELGLEEKNSGRFHVYRRATELGLDLVPAEAVVELAKVYDDQVFGECSFFAMEPIAAKMQCSSRRGYVMQSRDVVLAIIRSDAGRQLRAILASALYDTDLDTRWILSRPTKQPL